jgi:xylulokinase
MHPEPLYIGIDIGTSGARAVAIDARGTQRAQAKADLADFSPNRRSPAAWWGAAQAALSGVLAQVPCDGLRSIAVDGTSGTMVAVDVAGVPLADGLMYNDPCNNDAILSAIAANAPDVSAALGATSGLARALSLAALRPHRVLHQADWIAFHLSGRMVSDANNALKTGFDPVTGLWPWWIADTGLDPALLPEVVEPGNPVARITPQAAAEFGLPGDLSIVAGTTDGCASFLATGANAPGDGVSVLGTTLTIKLLSDVPINAPQYGIYSHRLLGNWLAGGASNTGGAALLAQFDAATLARLSDAIDPETDSGLDYYPLPAPGERFPIADPHLAPRLTPRPANDATFLQGLFEGIAGIEALAYARLAELGAPRLTSVRSVGGGGTNPVWTRIRARRLGVPMPDPISGEAAYGTALLARHGARP